MTTTKTQGATERLEIRKGADAIRAAHARGDRLVIVDGVTLAIYELNRDVRFTSGGEERHQVESWLVARPAGGELRFADGRPGFVPVYCVELGNNLRSGPW